MKYAAYDEYKTSAVDWLEAIPSHWTVKAARFGYSIQLGKMLQPESSSSLDAETPYLKSQHVKWESVRLDDLPLMWASPPELVKYGVHDGDLLVCEGGDVGRAGIIKNPPQGTIIQNALHRVRPRAQHDIRFLMYVLEHASGQSWFDIICNRSTIAHFTGEKFGALQVPEPPLDEQQTIARFLDAKTAQIDALMAQKRQLIDKLKEKRSALITRTVTLGLPPETAKAAGLEPNPEIKDSRVDWIGDIPSTWCVAPLKRRARFVEGPGIMASDFMDEGVPLIRISGVQGKYASLNGANYLDPELVSERWAHFKTKIGDLLISGSASTGLCSEVDEATVGCVPYTGIIIIRAIKNRACNAFLRWYFQSDQFLSQVQLMKAGSTIQHFGPTHLARMTIALPPDVVEQEAIAAFLDKATSEFDSMASAVEAAIDRLVEYRQAVITSAVTGKIDVRELA